MESLRLDHTRVSVLPGSQVFAGMIKLHSLQMNNMLLKSLPEGAFSTLHSLLYVYLQENLLGALPRQIFAHKARLVRVLLSNNQIRTVAGDAFHNSSAVRFIHMDHNRLEKLPAGLFSNQSELRALDLSYNHLTGSLPGTLFHACEKLEYLRLQHNRLSALHRDQFAGLRNLKVLRLENNRIGQNATQRFILPVRVFRGLNSLRSLHLDRLPQLSLTTFCDLPPDTVIYRGSNVSFEYNRACVCGSAACGYIPDLPPKDMTAIITLVLLGVSGIAAVLVWRSLPEEVQEAISSKLPISICKKNSQVKYKNTGDRYNHGYSSANNQRPQSQKQKQKQKVGVYQ